VFENKVLGILGSRKEEVTGGWRKLYGEECLDYCFLPDTTRLSFEEEEMGGACGTTGKNGTCFRGFGMKSRRKRTTWKDTVKDGRIILKCTLMKLGGRALTALIWFMTGFGGRLLKTS
jgi:hypothetical protein